MEMMDKVRRFREKLLCPKACFQRKRPLRQRRLMRSICACMPPCYYLAVKKLILIFLLLVVPLQFSWAAAGAYCQHEQGTSSFHFGHHAHSHQAKHDADDGKGKLNKVHLDCSSCHATGNVIFLDAANLVLPTTTRIYADARPYFYSSFIADGPRRPDRLVVA